MPKIQIGNAMVDAADRGWFVGSFIDEKLGLQHSDEVEMKWSVQPAGSERSEWVVGETRTAICLLISGKIEFEFRDRVVQLCSPGDFVMWSEGQDHKWRKLEDTTTLTVRWPSAVQRTKG